MRWWKREIIEVQAYVPGYDRNLKSFQNPCATIITLEMESLHSEMQVQMRFRGSDTIKSGKVGISQVVSKLHSKFAFTQHGVEAETAFSSTEQGFDQRGYRNHSGRVTELQNGEKTRWPLVKTRTQQSIFSGITSRGSKIFLKRRLHGIREQVAKWVSSSHS
jgi:hypothetical protein